MFKTPIPFISGLNDDLDLYVLVDDGSLPLHDGCQSINSASEVVMLGVSEKISFKISGNAIQIKTPAISPASNPSEYAWVFKIENAL